MKLLYRSFPICGTRIGRAKTLIVIKTETNCRIETVPATAFRTVRAANCQRYQHTNHQPSRVEVLVFLISFHILGDEASLDVGDEAAASSHLIQSN